MVQILPIDENNALQKPSFFSDLTFREEDNERKQILRVRMQVVNEEAFKKKKNERPTSIKDVLLENMEYYCAYVDYAGNQYIAAFKAPHSIQ